MAWDLLSIDRMIRDDYRREVQGLAGLEERVSRLDVVLGTPGVPNQKEIQNQMYAIRNRIVGIKTGVLLQRYTLETWDLLRKYRKILRTPLGVGRAVDPTQKKLKTQKTECTEQYFRLLQKHVPMLLNMPYSQWMPRIRSALRSQRIATKDQDEACRRCRGALDITDDQLVICAECGAEDEESDLKMSYRDADRVSVSGRYKYERSVHFRDCVSQFQGKQNRVVDDKVFKDLAGLLERHRLGSADAQHGMQYTNVTKNHIYSFLKELNYSKHYEDVTLIYTRLTGNAAPDISNLEPQLFNDFQRLTSAYDSLDLGARYNRTNFLNSQYILFQLLRRYGFECDLSYFSMLKTQERIEEHDEIYAIMCKHLGWYCRPVAQIM